MSLATSKENFTSFTHPDDLTGHSEFVKELCQVSITIVIYYVIFYIIYYVIVYSYIIISANYQIDTQSTLNLLKKC